MTTFTVAVGVERGTKSSAALRWAASEVQLRGGLLIAVRAWRPTPAPAASGAKPPTPAADRSELMDQARAELVADVRRALGTDSAVEYRLVHGGRRRVLRRVSREVDLLVVEAKPRTDPTLISTVSRRLLYTARCPVVIIPPAVAARPDTAAVVLGKQIVRGLRDAAGTAGRPGVRPPPSRPDTPGPEWQG